MTTQQSKTPGVADQGQKEKQLTARSVPQQATTVKVAPGDSDRTFWPYRARNRCLHLLTKPEGEEIRATTIASFSAYITEEIVDEAGSRTYRIMGDARRGGPFELEIPAEDFADSRRLKAALSAAAGARDPVHAGKGQHLGPAIQLLTTDDIVQTKRYYRTGWANGKFLLPGREPSGVTIHLPDNLPYSANTKADIDQGLDALENLIVSMGAERGCPILALMFQGPMAKLAGWRDKRYAIFISGLTGGLKTSNAQVNMAIYGFGFMKEGLLIKWGEGATSNAMMALATRAHDMPLLLDNYKPSTGGGARGFVNLIHTILEGGEKVRLNRAAELKDTKPVFCWPLITGEDVPSKDPATLARILVIPFTWKKGEPNPQLAIAQEKAMHLSAVGKLWLDWLESTEGIDAAKRAGAAFLAKREQWATHLRKIRPDSVNILRVASNLASNQLTWRVLTQHPVLGPLAKKYNEAHLLGLSEIAKTMSGATAESLEATRFLEGLQQLLAAQQVELPLEGVGGQYPERRPVIGWHDASGDNIYLLTDVAIKAVKQLLGPRELGGLSKQALHRQLDSLGVIASKGVDRTALPKKIAGKTRRVLHIYGDKLTW